MSKRARTVTVLVILALVPGVADARGGAGSASLEFLRLDAGVRQVGMGGVGVGLGGDVYSQAQNPAWLARLDSQEVGFSHASWLTDSSYQDLFYAHPMRVGVAGFHLRHLSYGKVDGYDDAGTKTSGISAGDLLLGGSFATYLPERRLSLGASVALAQETIGQTKASGFMADFGAAWFPWDEGRFERLSFGAAMKHLGPPVKFQNRSEALPRTIDIGAGMRFFDNALQTGLDLHYPTSAGPYASLGGEYWFVSDFAVRMGYESGQEQGPGVRVGFGMRIGQAQVDYAFFPIGDLGLTHHIGITMRFGGAARKQFRAGMKLMRAGNPAEALLRFEDALRLDPKHPEAGQMLRRAYRQIQQESEEVR